LGSHNVSGGKNTIRMTTAVIHTTNGNTAMDKGSSLTPAMLEVAYMPQAA
jgi:hypothetical protein